jgi:UPF0716 protein FxsA
MIRLVVGLFLIVVPVLELVLLIKVGQWLGAWQTVALVVAMAFTGLWIISRQSFTVLRQSLEALSEGRPPVTQVLDGLFLMLAGALFLMPGFITDALAILLLIPPARRAIARWGVAAVLAHAPPDLEEEWGAGRRAEWRREQGNQEGPIIEGEFERIGESSKPSRSNGAIRH